MGAYLSEPNLTKISVDSDNGLISYGASSMQGWRVTQEDAHNSIDNYDGANTSFFAVYDGHGGAEVAAYCSKYLPNLIKTLEAYKKGDFEEALRKGFLKFDASLISEEARKELNLLAGNSEPNSDNEKEEKDGEDDEKTEVEKLYDEATMPIMEVLKRYSKTKKNVKKQLNENRVKMGLEPLKDDENGGEDSDEEANAEAGGSSSTEEQVAEGKATADEDKENTEVSKKTKKEGEANGTDDGDGEDVNFNIADIKMFKKFALNRIKSMANNRMKKDKEGGEEESKEKKADEEEEEEEEEDDDDSEESEEDEGVDKDYENDDDDDDDEEEEEDDDDEDDDEEDEVDDEDGILEPQMDGGEPGFDSGCTAVVALVHEKKLYVANAGDSRCVVCRGGKAIDMSIDHKPEDDDERRRIEKAGGRVTDDGRVNGGLNLSRAIGDHTYKKNKQLELEDQMITSLPDIKTLEIEDSDEFMILACDGIWNSMSSQECVDYVRERLHVYPKLSQIIEELFMHCLSPNCHGDGTGCDNMTCIITTFKPYRSNILTNTLTNHSINSLESVETTTTAPSAATATTCDSEIVTVKNTNNDENNTASNKGVKRSLGADASEEASTRTTEEGEGDQQHDEQSEDDNVSKKLKVTNGVA